MKAANVSLCSVQVVPAIVSLQDVTQEAERLRLPSPAFDLCDFPLCCDKVARERRGHRVLRGARSGRISCIRFMYVEVNSKESVKQACSPEAVYDMPWTFKSECFVLVCVLPLQSRHRPETTEQTQSFIYVQTALSPSGQQWSVVWFRKHN